MKDLKFEIANDILFNDSKIINLSSTLDFDCSDCNGECPEHKEFKANNKISADCSDCACACGACDCY